MADKLHFSLVSPARELFSGEVDHVIAPGTDGEFGVLVNHAPFMTTLEERHVVRVEDNGDDDDAPCSFVAVLPMSPRRA